MNENLMPVFLDQACSAIQNECYHCLGGYLSAADEFKLRKLLFEFVKQHPVSDGG